MKLRSGNQSEKEIVSKVLLSCIDFCFLFFVLTGCPVEDPDPYGSAKVSMEDFDLLKVLGTGGNYISIRTYNIKLLISYFKVLQYRFNASIKLEFPRFLTSTNYSAIES